MSEFPLVAKGDADMSGFISEFSLSTAALSSFVGVVGTAAAAVGALAGVAMVAGIERATQFQAEMVKLNTLVGISKNQMLDYKDSILDLAPALGTQPEEMARAMFAITSGGERSAEAVKLLEQAAKAARLGLGDMASIGRVATAALQAFGDQGLTSEEAVDTMIATVREGNLVAEELSTAFGRVIGIAAQMGVTFQEVGAFIATFTRLGVNAEIAATSLRSALFAILSPGAEARKVFDQIGLSIEEMRRRIQDDGLTQAFIDMLRAAEGNMDVIGELVPNVRAMSGVLGTAAVQSRQYLEITDEINNSLGITNEAFEIVQETQEDAWADFVASIETAAIAIGDKFLPPLTRTVEVMTDATGWAGELVARITDIGAGLATLAVDIAGFGEEMDEAFDEGALLGLEETIRDRTTEQIRQMNAEATARLETLSNIQKAGHLEIEQQRELLSLQEQARRIRKLTNDELQRRADIGILSGEEMRFTTGPTEEQKESLDKLEQSLRENQMRLQERNRELLEEEIRLLNAMPAQRDRILGLYDENEAIKEQREERQRLAAEISRQEAAVRATQRRRERNTQRRREERRRERQRERERIAQIGADLQVAKIQEGMARMTRLAEDMSDAVTRSLLQIVEGTESVSDAFADMVTNILLQIARLKIEEAILGPLLRAFIGIPDAPGAISAPEIGNPLEGVDPGVFSDPILGSVNAATPTMKSGAAVVHQSFTFAPNMIDQASGLEFLKRHSTDIMRVAQKGARQGVLDSRKI